MKLTEDVLRKLGFRDEGRDITDKPAFRLKIPFDSKQYKYSYAFELQVVLGNYPESNPNSGIVSIYDPGVKDAHMIVSEEKGKKSNKDKIDHLLDEDETHRVGIKYINIPPMTQPIAWHVTTLERLNQIYTALTRNPPLKTKKKQP